MSDMIHVWNKQRYNTTSLLPPNSLDVLLQICSSKSLNYLLLRLLAFSLFIWCRISSLVVSTGSNLRLYHLIITLNRLCIIYMVDSIPQDQVSKSEIIYILLLGINSYWFTADLLYNFCCLLSLVLPWHRAFVNYMMQMIEKKKSQHVVNLS